MVDDEMFKKNCLKRQNYPGFTAKIVGNKVNRRIPKRVFQENEASQILRK